MKTLTWRHEQIIEDLKEIRQCLHLREAINNAQNLKEGLTITGKDSKGNPIQLNTDELTEELDLLRHVLTKHSKRLETAIFKHVDELDNEQENTPE